MKTRTLFAFATACCALNCVSATVSVDNICTHQSIVLPDAPVSTPVPAGFVVSKDFPVSIVDPLSKFKDVGDLSVSINSFSLSDGDFSWVSHVKADATVADSGMPLTLTDVDVSGMTTNINLPIDPGAQASLIEMLKAGDTSITVYLTTGNGTLPSSDTTITASMCVGASVSVKKSL